MEKERVKRGHVVVVPYPAQGHVTPLYQFSKRLVSTGIKATLTLTSFHFNSINPHPSGPVAFDTISDGYDHGGFDEAESTHVYLHRLKTFGSETLAQVIQKHQGSDNPVTCIVYDSFLPWALDVAKEFGLTAAPFFTQSCACNYIYYLACRGNLQFPIDELSFLEPQDLPSYFVDSGSHYPGYFEMLKNQFFNFDKADFVLVNIFYKLEVQEAEAMSKVCSLMTVGPTVPSVYLDQRIKMDNSDDLALFDIRDASYCTEWLNTRLEGSVAYVAFGSMAKLSNKQMEELAWALSNLSNLSNFSFLWVVRASEAAKLPVGFLKTVDREKGLVVNWSRQLEMLSNKAVGCFVTHCGWNSTIEALSLGVPMVAMPQWTDQPTNAKYIEDVWKVGVRVKVDKESGIARREEIEFCIKEAMEGEKAREAKQNAKKWRELAIEAVDEGGTSDLNIDAFVSKVKCLQLQQPEEQRD